jgi:hypothetical protein
MDGSVVGGGCNALMIHVVYKGLALPLAWRVRQGPKGHFPEDLHIAYDQKTHAASRSYYFSSPPNRSRHCRGPSRSVSWLMDLPAPQMDKKQHVICPHTTQRPDLGSEEVGCTSTSMCVRINSFQVVVVLRSGAGVILWRLGMLPPVWSLIVYPRLPGCQRSGRSPRRAILLCLLCHTDDQRLQLLVDPGAPWGLALLRTVKLLVLQL